MDENKVISVSAGVMTGKPMRRTTVRMLFFLLLATPLFSHAAMNLPPSPEGYAWKQIEELSAAVLLPTGWSFLAENSGNRFQYFLAGQEGGDSTKKNTGSLLTVTAITGKKETAQTGIEPSGFIAALFEEIRTNQVLERTQSAPQGPFETIRYQYVYQSDDGKPFREYALLVANDATGTCYVFTFQAPLSRWEGDWQTITVVLDNIYLDDEI